jgi:hypothetical protein
MANKATNLRDSLGIKNRDQEAAEMAGAVTRLVLNDVIREAKERAKIRDETLAKTPAETPAKNG